MEGKTKAVALDRQCGYWYRRTKLRFDNTRAFAGGQSLSSPEWATTKSLPFEFPRLGENPVVQFCNSVLLVFSRVQICTLLVKQYLNHAAKSGEALKYGIFPPLKTTDLWFKNGRNLPFNPNHLIKKQSVKLRSVHNPLNNKQNSKMSFGQPPYLAKSEEAHYPDIGYHSFGSMPRCCNSLRIILLIQAASDSSPSCCWACSISSRNSGSSLNWNGGLPRLSFLCVDTSITPDVMCLCVMTHYIHVLQIATPRSAVTLPRRLTKPLYEVTIMAELQSTQTRPEFTWRFLGKYSASKDMRRIVVHIIATREAEARSCLPLWDLVFAARLPANHLEVLRHA